MANTTDLTTPYLFGTYAGLDQSETSSKQIQQIITGVSKAIERFCDRTFTVTTYKQWLNGTGESWILLPEWPVDRIYGISSGQTTSVLKVKNTADKFATVEAKTTGLYLFSVNDAGTETDNELLYSSNATIDDLSTAINALSSWEATIQSGQDDEPSVMIKPTAGEYALTPDYVDIEIAYETTQTRLVDDTDRMVERPGGVKFWPGSSNIFAWWKAGYTLPEDDDQHTKLETEGDLPKDLTQVANIICKAVYDSAEQDIGSAKKQDTIDYKTELEEGARGIISKMLEESAQTLTPYRRLA